MIRHLLKAGAAIGKPLLTLDSPANGNLVGIGAEVMGTELWELKGRELNSLLDAKGYLSECAIEIQS